MVTTPLTISEAAGLIKERELSPVELIRDTLETIAAAEPTIRAFVTVLDESALIEAKAVEHEIAGGQYRGPLHGIPVGVKDLYETKGVKTTAGSAILASHVPKEDAAAVDMLKRAGAIVIGKTQTHEFAYGGITPTTRNPWDTGRIPGGSSGGSAAAVAAGECLMAMGTDTAGSIRIPASYCGVVGLKPSFGRISRHGVIPLSWSLDHVGPLTRTVEDAAIVLNSIAGHDSRDPGSVDVPIADYKAFLGMGVKGVTIGVPSNYFFQNLYVEVEAAVRSALASLEREGASLRQIEAPLTAYYRGALLGIQMPEASAYHRPMLRRNADLYQEDVRHLLQSGELMLATDYIQALQARSMIHQAWRRVFDDVDVVVTPATPSTAPRVGQDALVWPSGESQGLLQAMIRLVAPFNLVGLPAISVPCGNDPAGLPIGLQVVGRPFDEATTCRVAAAVESLRQSVWPADMPGGHISK